MRPSGIVTLLSDFGCRDAYAGIMKGVALGACPSLTCVDLTHEIPPQAIAVGALVLRSAVAYFPPGTVHLAVVDPGVGGARAALAVLTEHGVLVGPDNGLLAPAAAALGLREVRRIAAADALAGASPGSARRAATFHGRDVFAPLAGRLAGGMDFAAVGPVQAGLVPLALPPVRVESEALRGEVIHVDGFGNLLSNIGVDDLRAFRDQALSVTVAAMSAPLASTYSDVAAGELVAMVSSWDTVEVAVRDGSAAARLGVGRGAAVRVAPR